MFVDHRHHGTRLARKVAAGIAAETSPTSRARRSTRARVKRRFHGRARRTTSHSTSMRQGRADEPDEEEGRDDAVHRVGLRVDVGEHRRAWLAAVDSLLLAEGTTLSARPPMADFGSTPPRWRIVAVMSESWATPTRRVEADASRPGRVVRSARREQPQPLLLVAVGEARRRRGRRRWAWRP